ncbi:MAG: serine hydroxymethyltransferase [bacterium]|nr:serine hydroxymethyltransferase [bacterium]
MNLQSTDQEIFDLIQKETQRQHDVLEMIPSENYASKAVLEALGSSLTNKYSEGYQYARYYQGNEYVDKIEEIARDRIKKLFNVSEVNLQPYSGSPANLAVYMALMQPGDTIMGLKLAFGGHLTHGDPVTASGTIFKSVQYQLDNNGIIDLDEVRNLAHTHKPQVIVIGTTAYPRNLPYKEFSEIAEEVGAFLHADISHIAGMVCAGVLESPIPYAHTVMFTTHKTFRGPRGAVILTTDKGLAKDPDLSKKINKWVFPGLQGWPHNNTTAAIGVAALEAFSEKFKNDQKQTLINAQVLAKQLISKGYELISNGTDNHLILLSLVNKGINGRPAAVALEEANIICNRNSVPHDTMPPFYPSGLRFGTPCITTRGMKESEMTQIANWIDIVLQVTQLESQNINIKDKDERSAFKQRIIKDPTIQKIKKEVKELCDRFPID